MTQNDAANNKEIEVKLILAEGQFEKMMDLPWFKAMVVPGSQKVRNLISTYYDTAEGIFRSNGVAYRVRSKGDGTYEATAKRTLHKADGLSERLEINIPLTDGQPVLKGFAEQGLGCDLDQLAPKGVQPLFTVNVERLMLLLKVEDTVIELALDKGNITNPYNDKTDAIDELELELKEGSEAVLMELVDKLKQQIVMRGEDRSKFARGLALLVE